MCSCLVRWRSRRREEWNTLGECRGLNRAAAFLFFGDGLPCLAGWEVLPGLASEPICFEPHGDGADFALADLVACGADPDSASAGDGAKEEAEAKWSEFHGMNCEGFFLTWQWADCLRHF
jgi:hypothetical protein